MKEFARSVLLNHALVGALTAQEFARRYDPQIIDGSTEQFLKVATVERE